ncbi:hypothetical protein [Variovorax sp. LjRoot178]|uniref:hypothetical protein n=1 Tax=Variovorax sp. LjRoot178 TaxID=3342277 RepID=UPI003ECFB9D9
MLSLSGSGAAEGRWAFEGRLLAKCSSLQRATKAGVTCQLPPENDAALVEGGIKVKPGASAEHADAPDLGSLNGSPLAKQPNACTDSAVKALLATPHKEPALTKEPLEAVLDTCDDSPNGKRDHAPPSVSRGHLVAVDDPRFRRRCSKTCAVPTKPAISTHGPSPRRTTAARWDRRV